MIVLVVGLFLVGCAERGPAPEFTITNIVRITEHQTHFLISSRVPGSNEIRRHTLPKFYNADNMFGITWAPPELKILIVPETQQKKVVYSTRCISCPIEFIKLVVHSPDDIENQRF